MTPRKIVMIEDSKAASGVLKDVLAAEGYTVLHAADGVSGLALARRERPDLILLDLLLPKLNGYDVCNALMRDNIMRHTPVLIISTLDTPESIDKAKQCGARNFMKKPYNLDDLLREIKRLLPKE
ncbi:MAG: response regulator [Elusimicrobiales bacterium]|nr:response regulator [Elusimicrobiales bacterium]